MSDVERELAEIRAHTFGSEDGYLAHRDRSALLRIVDDLRAELASAKAERERIIGLGGPWPLTSILARLADASDHLLTDHDCDAHGWEGVTCARDAARALLAKLESPEAGGDVDTNSPVRTEDAGRSESPGDAPLASGGSVAAQRAAKQEP